MKDIAERLMRALNQEQDGLVKFEAVVKEENAKLLVKELQREFWFDLSQTFIFRGVEKYDHKSYGILCKLAEKKEEKYLKAMEYLLKLGAHTECQKDDFMFMAQPLFLAASVNNLPAVKLLLRYGAQNNALYIPSDDNYVEIAKILMLDLILKRAWPEIGGVRIPFGCPSSMVDIIISGTTLEYAIVYLLEKNDNKNQDILNNLRKSLKSGPTLADELITIARQPSPPIAERYRRFDTSEKRLATSIYLLFRRENTLVSSLPRPILNMVLQKALPLIREPWIPLLTIFLEQAKKNPATDAEFLKNREAPRPR